MDKTMDKITTAINKWLLKYEPIKEIADTVHTEEMTDDVDTLALQRTGVEKLKLKYLSDKGWYRQYQYNLLLKKYSEDDEQRTQNLDWLDDLSEWIEQKNIKKDLPILEDNKIVKEVSCANAITYETDENGTISAYYLQLYFNIKGGLNNGQ